MEIRLFAINQSTNQSVAIIPVFYEAYGLLVTLNTDRWHLHVTKE